MLSLSSWMKPPSRWTRCTSSQAHSLIQALKMHYLSRTPTFDHIAGLMQKEGLISDPMAIENDHIALRTINTPQLGIKSLAKLFTAFGYTQMQKFEFPSKHLNALWFKPPSPDLPRVFLSELKLEEVSREAREILAAYSTLSEDPVDALEPISAAKAWGYLTRHVNAPWSPDDSRAPTMVPTPSWTLYRRLAEESEYASWWLVNRHHINHATFSIHNLPPPYNTLEMFNQFLESHQIQLNDSGGTIKTSEDGLLKQSSTVAVTRLQRFTEGWFPVPWAFVEFAERKVLPEYADLPLEAIKAHHRRDGFEAANADKIFESTFDKQARKFTA
eukprot:NODE_2369_length_1196_cov_60.690365_g2255_i0.p1 GENE.NODE_2369_length_1196_cov_60.690365_g2255_i0~~NODE_2369_length_1196_cov_60.690365_g2255_i0.p1  ORF type:complete len:345 (-),score=82.65 NODE_2369_length_1196_cov_60.690365_g2255_i0:161-1150(-)